MVDGIRMVLCGLVFPSWLRSRAEAPKSWLAGANRTGEDNCGVETRGKHKCSQHICKICQIVESSQSRSLFKSPIYSHP